MCGTEAESRNLKALLYPNLCNVSTNVSKFRAKLHEAGLVAENGIT